MFELERAIAEWRRQMADAGLKTSASLDELEAHLRDDVAQRVRSGLGAEKAFENAVRQLGGINALNSEFAKAARRRLRKYAVRVLAAGLAAFFLGVAFSRVALVPSMLAASQKYSQWYGFRSSGVDVSASRHFVNKLMLGTGLVFEMPLVILILIKVGVLNFRRLSKARRYVIVANLILAALLTTPEIFTQLIMFVPLQALYELTVCAARYRERRDEKIAAAVR